MIYGYVRDTAPIVLLTLPGIMDGLNVEFVLDTGFAGELTLPPTIAQRMNLDFVERRKIRLADGAVRECAAGAVRIDWDDEPRLVEVLVLDGRPLLGMVLLYGSQIFIDAQDGGEVTIETA